MACSQQRFSSIHKSCLVITGSLLAGGGWSLGGGLHVLLFSGKNIHIAADYFKQIVLHYRRLWISEDCWK